MKAFARHILAACVGMLCATAAFAQQKEYKATVFGVKSDGTTDNTGTIQRAIDFISENGGGTLVFYVGRYLTGSIELKEGVTICLKEAAVLVGTTNIYGYKGQPGLIWAKGCKDIAITGKGVIEQRCGALQANIDAQKALGHLPEGFVLPQMISFDEGCSAQIDKELKLVADTAAKPYRR